ncbi:hypothetical protein ACROYT_G004973 [Oculina patagonica]
MSDEKDYTDIVPKNKKEARGTDFCGTNEYYYIIRSDLGVYMRSKDFHSGSDIQIFSLHPSCSWGDHYLATGDGYYYIIKGNEYRRVTNMNKDLDAVVYSLHPNCQGGSYYYAAFGYYYIVFTDRGVYRRVKNMNSDEEGHDFRIHEAYQDGIYYWGVKNYVYCLKQAGKWGVTYHRSTNMNSDEDSKTYSVHPSVLNFLPGGVAQTKGKAFDYWEKLKSIDNVSDVAVDWERDVEESVGFKKSEMSSIEQDWSIHLGASYSSGILTEAISKYQFSFDAQYGGKSVNTEQQDWSDVHVQTERVKMHIPPNGTAYVWQYQMGFGDEKNLFCVDLKVTNDDNPPDEPPESVKSEESSK